MADIKLGSDGDILIQNGKISFTESVGQRVSIALRTLKGEWFLDEKIGIPYFQKIFAEKITKTEVDLIMKNQISCVKGVEKIIEFNSTIINGLYEYTCSILTSQGQVEKLKGNTNDIFSR
jgi:hypothetical protein